MNIWYPHFPADYLRDTYELSLAEHGAYRLLLDHYYASGGPLPAARPLLYRLLRAETVQEKCTIDAVLDRFFSKKNRRYHNKRADAQLLEMERTKQRLSNQGRKGAEKRWSNDGPANGPANGPAIAEPMPGQWPTDSKTHHITSQDRAAPSRSVDINLDVGDVLEGGMGETSARAPQTRRASERARAQRFPKTFSLTEPLRTQAIEHGIPPSEVAREWQQFENHHRAKGSRFLDWPRAWLTWCGNYQTFHRGGSHGQGESPDQRRRQRNAEAFEQARRDRERVACHLRGDVPPGNES